MQVQVLVAQQNVSSFDYYVPEGMDVSIGDVVQVPFGKRQLLGIIWGDGESNLPKDKIKAIISKCDVHIISSQSRRFIEWVGAYTTYSLGSVLKMMLPVPYRVEDGFVDPSWQHHSIVLREDQQHACDEIISYIQSSTHHVCVIDGVTGSGKTELYLRVAMEALQHTHGQVCILLPEICLSTQLLIRIEHYCGVRPHVWHSHLTPKQRQLTWKGIAQGKIRFVVGARSALFLPFPQLSCIIVDEEHDGSYKQEEGGVVYHGRDMAVARGFHASCPVLLASATPSLETVLNMRSGKYKAFHLEARHGGASPPSVHLADMRHAEKGRWISHELEQAIVQRLEKQHQTLLFLNRRGYAPLTLCRSCGYRWMCSHCDSWLVEHRLRKKRHLICHHCGVKHPIPTECTECLEKDTIVACGPGVERVAEEVGTLFPSARIAMMTRDTITTQKQAEAVVSTILNGEVDIIIGTQMVAKGHHFPKLSLVGVIDADLGMSGGDLRAAEKCYQLLHQVAGRAGRETLSGDVWIQTYYPDSYLIKALKERNREVFLDQELKNREQHHMPPYHRLVALIVSGKKEAELSSWCQELAVRIPRHADVQILGPVPAPIFQLRGRYRYRFLISGPKNIRLQAIIHAWLSEIALPSSIHLKIDVDPINFF